MKRVLASRFGAASPIWQLLLKSRRNFASNARYFVVSKTPGKTLSPAYGCLNMFMNSVRQHSRSFTSSRVLRSSEATTAGASFASTNAFIRWYLEMIQKHPVLTKSVTAASIYTSADLTSQVISFAASDAFHVSDKLDIDVQRTMRMAAYGLILSGPTLHLWFNFMSRTLPKTDIISTVKKMVLGQTLYGPIITVVFFSLNALLQGENGSEIFARLKRDFLPTIKSGAMYWPLCDFITYRYVPVHLQPLVSNSFAFIWTVYLTYMAGLKKVTLEETVTS